VLGCAPPGTFKYQRNTLSLLEINRAPNNVEEYMEICFPKKTHHVAIERLATRQKWSRIVCASIWTLCLSHQALVPNTISKIIENQDLSTRPQTKRHSPVNNWGSEKHDWISYQSLDPNLWMLATCCLLLPTTYHLLPINDSWLMPYFGPGPGAPLDPRAGPDPRGHEPWAVSLEPWAMNHQACITHQELL